MDTTILNVALPTLVRHLRTTDSQLEWIVDAYTLVFAGLLLTSGELGDRFGRRRALMAGLAVFTVASVGCALSGSASALIAWRATAGVGAALIFPSTLAILTGMFVSAHERQQAIALWAGAAGIGIALGPIAGGILLSHYSWNSVFWLNLPVGLAALAGAVVFVPATRVAAKAASFDPAGTVLSIAGLSSLVFGIIEGPSHGWTSRPVLIAFSMAAVSLCAFVVVELRSARPMLDLRLFKDRTFAISCFAMSSLYFCLFGTIYFLTQDLQFVLNYGPLAAGVRILPFATVLMVVATLTPKLVIRFGPGRVIVVGLTTVGAAQVVFAASTTGSGYGWLCLSQCVFALGMGLVIAPATALIMASLPEQRAGIGSALNDTTRQVGAALGVAVMGSIGDSLYRGAIASRLSHLLPPAVFAQAHSSLGGALGVAKEAGPAAGARIAGSAVSSFAHGLRVAELVGLVVALVAAGLSVRLIGLRPAATDGAATAEVATDGAAAAEDAAAQPMPEAVR